MSEHFNPVNSAEFRLDEYSMQLCFNLNRIHSCVGKALITKPNGSVIIYGGGGGGGTEEKGFSW